MAQIISTGQSLITANTKIKICHGYGCLFVSFRIFHCRKLRQNIGDSNTRKITYDFN